MASMTLEHAVPERHTDHLPRAYSPEAFRAILSRQPEWKVREALEDGNIPACHEQEAREWLEQKAAEFRQSDQPLHN